MKTTRWLGVAVAWLTATTSVQAHFLFLRITPQAEAGRAAEVYFSDLPEAGDTRFIANIAHTKLWLQTTPGKFTPLKVHQGEDRLRAVLPGGSLAVVGHCEYGVRPGKIPFLLRHFPKAVDGTADEVNKLEPTDKVPLEIFAHFHKDNVRLTAFHNGKLVPNADFYAVGKGLSNVKFQADSDGSATWKPPHAGRFAVYFSVFTKADGKRGDEKYGEIRDFATLTFAWPLAPTGADPKAVALFSEARDARAAWRDFPGFTANIAGKVDGRSFKGTATLKTSGAVSLSIDDDVAWAWVKEQLESIYLHRRASEGSKDSQPVLRFADQETDHPLGRLLIFDKGRFASSYRVKDKQITVVNRVMKTETMTITAVENTKNKEGHFLPRSYTVHYWDAASGNLLRTATVQESWQRVDQWDLPASRTMTTASGAGLSVRGFTLSKHKLNASK
jgi:hypothetical protein